MNGRALVTGGTGFVGQWLIRALLERGMTVGSFAPDGGPARWVLSDEERRQVRWIGGDVRRSSDIGNALDELEPDYVFHLAAVAFPPDAASNPADAYEINLLGFVRLAHELRLRAGEMDPVILVVGSAEEYGRHDEAETPLREEMELRPGSTYAVTKVAQELVARQAFAEHGTRVVMTRSFNHSGPGHAPHYLLPALVARCSGLRRTGGRSLPLGNQGVVRDYSHVADVAEAYCLLVERGGAGEVYNVCSGTGVTVRELAEEVLHRMGVEAEISSDPALVRRGDIPVLVGSPDKLRTETGWKAARGREEMIDDLIEWFDAAAQ